MMNEKRMKMCKTSKVAPKTRLLRGPCGIDIRAADAAPWSTDKMRSIRMCQPHNGKLTAQIVDVYIRGFSSRPKLGARLSDIFQLVRVHQISLCEPQPPAIACWQLRSRSTVRTSTMFPVCVASFAGSDMCNVVKLMKIFPRVTHVAPGTGAAE